MRRKISSLSCWWWWWLACWHGLYSSDGPKDRSLTQSYHKISAANGLHCCGSLCAQETFFAGEPLLRWLCGMWHHLIESISHNLPISATKSCLILRGNVRHSLWPNSIIKKKWSNVLQQRRQTTQSLFLDVLVFRLWPFRFSSAHILQFSLLTQLLRWK